MFLSRRALVLVTVAGIAATSAAPAAAWESPTRPTFSNLLPAFSASTSVPIEWNASTFDPSSNRRWYKLTLSDVTALPTIVESREVSADAARSTTFSGLVSGHRYRVSLEASSYFALGGEVWNSNPVAREFTIDATAPSGSIKINGGAAYTTSRDVTVKYAASDPGGAGASGVDRMMVNTSPGFPCEVVQGGEDTSSCPRPFASTEAVTLREGSDGPRSFYVKFMDAAAWPGGSVYGNRSPLYSATIVLDRVPPSASVVLPATRPTVGAAAAFSVSAQDATSGVDVAATSWKFGDGTTPAVGDEVTHVYGRTGTFSGTVTVKDKAGHATTRSFSVVVDPAASAPSPSASGAGSGSGGAGGGSAGTPGQAALQVQSAAVVGAVKAGRAVSVRVKLNRKGTAVVTVTRKVRGVVKVVLKARRAGGPGVVVVRFMAPPAGSYSLGVTAGTSTKKLRLVVR